MANNVINTRIQLKVDTLTNWQTNNPVLLDGEIAIAKIDIVDPENKHLQPAMIKVGDGTSTFNQLDWVSAKAADVYEWAKASTKPEYNFEELKNIPAFITPDELENYYTKDEVNSKLSAVYRYKGTKDYYFQLPTENEIGDVYNIIYASGENYNTDHRPRSYNILEVVSLDVYWSNANGIFINVDCDNNKNNLYTQHFEGKDTIEICINNLRLDSVTSFTLPILKGIPAEPTSGVCLNTEICQIFINANDPNFSKAYEGDSQYETYYDYILAMLNGWSEDTESIYLYFNNEYQYTLSEPYLVKDGDNVAWTGTEWDVLAGTFEIDLSDYATKDELSEKANTKDLAAIATSGDIYDISNAGAVQTSVGTDDTGEKYIVFNCGSSTTVI